MRITCEVHIIKDEYPLGIIYCGRFAESKRHIGKEQILTTIISLIALAVVYFITAWLG